jgi:colanic acid biosynthesis glycosyl transferase WcaI
MNKMGRVIFINRYFYPDHSATSQLVSDLAFDLAQRDVDVQVITSRQVYDNPAAALLAQDRINGVLVRRVWTSRFGRHRLWGRAIDYLTFYSSTLWCLWCVAVKGDVIVAKTDPPLISVIAAFVSRLRGATLVNWLQDLFPEVATSLDVKPVKAMNFLLRCLRNYSLRKASFNIVLGERMAARIVDQGIKQATVKVIHNWSDGQMIRPIVHKHNDLRRQWGLEGLFVVCYSGNMGRAHEFQTIIDAATLLRNEAGIVFLFVGDGAYRVWLERETARRCLGNVIFKPYQPRARLMQSLGVADVHLISLQPALEGLIVPSKFYGVAAAGRPVLYIGDPDGEIPRIISREKCGLTILPGNAKAVADCLRQWLANSALVSEMGRNARIAFERRFDKEQALSVWRGVLQQAGVSASARRADV